MDQPKLFKLLSYAYIPEDNPNPCLRLDGEYVDYNGVNFGRRLMHFRIPKFVGDLAISALTALPLHLHPDPEGITKRLLERGHRWESYAGRKFCEYRGIGIDADGSRSSLDGRVMVDAHTFFRINADTAFVVSPTFLAPLTDEQLLLAPPTVHGFSFTMKGFLELHVDNLSPIDWNTGCFDRLVLPNHQKELVQALVTEHSQLSDQEHEFRDIVKGKGQGLILLLHGPPGVGKTLTAECIAEFSQRPLYTVSPWELGTTAAELDQRLSWTLDIAETWNAVLLIDDADVFLEHRLPHDTEHASLVSVFLRALEHYSGVLFMTTNGPVSTFDGAFKSCIHLPLRYGNPFVASRLKMWKNFLDGVRGVDVDVDEQGFRRLAAKPLNGRQIRNVVRTATGLVAFRKRRLDLKQLEQVVDIQLTFVEEFEDEFSEDVDMGFDG